MKTIKNLLKIIPLLACAYAGSAQALIINFSHDANMDARALRGFQQAANQWQAVLKDDVHVNLTIGFSQLEENVLGATWSNNLWMTYDNFRTVMNRDAKSVFDQKAVSNLPAGSCLNILMNGTNVNPAGVGSSDTFLDNNCDTNNQYVNINTANLRALGVLGNSDKRSDGEVLFSSDFAPIFDFDQSDGIDAGKIDFTGVAAHEIGHALGFVSGVDVLDYNLRGDYPDRAFPYITPADVFRCSPQSKAAGAHLDWAADSRTKFFSLDNCTTALSVFSLGDAHGDGNQASHWKDNQGIGLLDPTASRGEVLAISNMDLVMFDVIGWDVPEPASIALFGLGAAALAGSRRRKQK